MPLTHLLHMRAEATSPFSWVVGLIIERDGHILLLKRRPDDFLPNLWEIPGGHVDPGESLENALARELFEETGLRLAEIICYVNHYDYAGEFGPTRQWNFAARTSGGAIIHPEHVSYQWTAPRLLSELPMTSEMRRTLDLYLGLTNPPAAFN